MRWSSCGGGGCRCEEMIWRDKFSLSVLLGYVALRKSHRMCICVVKDGDSMGRVVSIGS